MIKVPKLRYEVTERINKKIRDKKHQQFHEYATYLDENLAASSFRPAEKLYLDFQRRFTLTKVPKLRYKVIERMNEKVS